MFALQSSPKYSIIPRTMAARVLPLALILVGLLAGLGGPLSVAQSSLQVEARVDAHTIGSEDRLTYAIRVRGAALEEISTPEPPATSNLVLLDTTPSTEQYIMGEDSDTERAVVFAWRYRPMRPGAAQLRSTTVRIQNQELTTGAIDVDVSSRPNRAGQPPSGMPFHITEREAESSTGLVSSDDLFIEVTPADAEVFVGEQLGVEYRLYYRPGVRLRQSRLADAWEAPGFWREELTVESQPRSEDVDAAYRYLVIKRVATFPTQTGMLQIDPLRVETEATPGFQSARGRPRGAHRQFEEILLSSGTVDVQANPLPEGAPGSFQGAVGRFEWTRNGIPDRVEVGSALTFQIAITGDGNLYSIEPPPLNLPDHVDVFDPEVEVDLQREGTTLKGTRTFTYTVVPRSPTEFVIPEMEWSYFDPEAESYVTHEASAARVRVEPGPERPSETVADADPPPLQDHTSSNEIPWGVIIAGLGVAGLIAGGWGYGLWSSLWAVLVAGVKSEDDDTPPVAREVAVADIQKTQQHLDAAQRALRDNDPKPFYRALEQAVVGLVAQRTGHSARGMTHRMLDEELRAHDVDFSVRETAQELLKACDQAQFSPSEPSYDSMLAALDAAHTLVLHLDATLPTEPLASR